MKNFTGALVAGEAMTDRQSQVMARLGFDAGELAQRMGVDARGAIIDVMDELAKLPQYEQSAALSQLFGEESVGAIAPLLSNVELLGKAFALTSDEQIFAGAMTKEYGVVAQTTAANMMRLGNWMDRLSVSIGSVLLPEINDLLAQIFPMVGAVIQWAEAHPRLIRSIARIAFVLLALKVALLAVAVLLSPLQMAFWALRGAIGGVVWAAGALLRAGPLLGRAVMVAWRVGAIAASAAMRVMGGTLRLVGQAMLWVGRVFLANPIVATVALIAGAVYLIYQHWDGITEWFWAKIERIRAAFDSGLLNGVLRIIAEFNPFTLFIETALGLSGIVTDAIGRIDLFQTGLAMIESLKSGAWSVLETMVAGIQARLSAIVPAWMKDAWDWASGGEGAPAQPEPSAQWAGSPNGRATGGPVRAGQIYRWMEEGEEYFQPRVDGNVISARGVDALRGRARATGASISIGDIVINATPAQSAQDIARAVRRELERLTRSAPLHDGGAYAD